MITKLTHSTVYVLDQDRAKDFYVNKLGLECRDDARMGPFRWLTVGPKTQPDVRIILMAIGSTPMMTEEHAAALAAREDVGARSPTRAHSSMPIGPRRTVSLRSTGTVRYGALNAIASAQHCSPSVDWRRRGANTSARVSTGGSQSSVSSSRGSTAMGN